MRKLIVLAALAVATYAPTASARNFAEIYTECGLGALIAPTVPAVAAVTNVTWDLGTTAISSNVSSPATCAGVKAKAAALILDGYPELEKDLARGEGQHLAALLAISGCREEAHPSIVNAVRGDLARSLAHPDRVQTRVEQAEQLFNVYTDRIENEFASVCSAG